MFTIEQVAKFVGKSPGYVRQHINRKHLAAKRLSGVGLVVELNQLKKWASHRGLTLSLDSIDRAIQERIKESDESAKVFQQGILSKSVRYTVIIEGSMGPNELEALIKKLSVDLDLMRSGGTHAHD